MARRFPDLDSPHALAYDGLWSVLESDQAFATHFIGRVKWDGDPNTADYLDIPPPSRLPQVAINVLQNPAGQLDFEFTHQELLLLELSIWSDGWDVRDFWGLSNIVRLALSTADARSVLARVGVCRMVWTQGAAPILTPETEVTDRLIVGSALLQLQFNLKQG